jgi:hypothetical protein
LAILTPTEAELDLQLTEDRDALRTRVAIDNVSFADVRQLAAPILRRWLVEDQISVLARAKNVEFLFAAPDLRQVYRECDARRMAAFFALGCSIRGLGFYGVSASSQPAARPPTAPDTPANLSPSNFVRQRTIYFMGQYATRGDVIRYFANKLGGVHYDATRDKTIELFLDMVRTKFRLRPDAKSPTPHFEVDLSPSTQPHIRGAELDLWDLATLDLVATAGIFAEATEIKR